MTVRNGAVQRQWRFYDLPIYDPPEPMPASAAVEKLGEALKTAVTRQMVADVPVGAFLSGGLDSSMVVALAREHTEKQPMQCFTIGFTDKVLAAEGITEDLPYAKRVAQHLGVKLHTVHVGPEMINQLSDMIYFLDEPQADPAPLNVLFISRLARENGMKVLLSGAGGDDIFTGYRRHYSLMCEKYWTWLPAAARKLIRDTASPALRFHTR